MQGFYNTRSDFHMEKAEPGTRLSVFIAYEMVPQIIDFFYKITNNKASLYLFNLIPNPSTTYSTHHKMEQITF